MDKMNSLKEEKRKIKNTQSMQFRILATIIFAMFAITNHYMATLYAQPTNFLLLQNKNKPNYPLVIHASTYTPVPLT